MMFKQKFNLIFLIFNLCLLDHCLTENTLSDAFIYKKLITKIGRLSSPPQCALITDEKRIDCFPESTSNEKACLDRRCCWSVPQSKDGKIIKFKFLNYFLIFFFVLNFKLDDPPYCYFPIHYQAYQLTKHTENENGHYLELIRHTPISYSNVYQTIFIEIIYLDQNSLRVRFNTTQAKLFVPPIKLDLPKFDSNQNKQYEVKFQNNVISVYRKQTNTLVWSADLNTLVLSEQFNQIFTTISSNLVFGLGEHKDVYEKVVKNRKRFLFFNRDQATLPDMALYGHHSFYLNYEINNENVNAHSVLLLNAHPIELIMMNKPALLWRTLGGTFDFIINLGPTPIEAIKQHVQIVGKPPLIPYWALGFHLCRYGYNTIQKAKEATERTIQAGIPYDVMWLDIDFMQDRTMFKVNQGAFPNLKEWIDELHSRNMKFVPIIDPGLDDGYDEKDYPYYKEAESKDLLIKHESNEVLKAKVWSKSFNGWIDFSNPNATEFWTNVFKKWNEEIGFDGAWIDM